MRVKSRNAGGLYIRDGLEILIMFSFFRINRYELFEKLIEKTCRSLYNIIKVKERGIIMSTAKAMVIDRINNISDNLDEMQIIERLYMLARLEHSVKRCEEEGSISDSDLDSHFKAKREALLNA